MPGAICLPFTHGRHLRHTCRLDNLPHLAAGDTRGHWSPLLDLHGRVIEPGGKLNIPHHPTHQRALAIANEPPKILTEHEIKVVAERIGHIVHLAPGMPGAISGLNIMAAAIEPTHVHLLLSPLPHDLDDAVGRIKGQTSSALLKLPENSAGNRKRTWTAGYWKSFIFESRKIPIVREYIERHNLRRGLPARPYDWITPTAADESPAPATTPRDDCPT